MTGRVSTDVDIRELPGREVRFTSGNVVYVEALLDGRWVGRYWSAEGRVNWLYETWMEDAFSLEIGRRPVRGNWKWVSASEAPATERGARHYVVQLSNSACPIEVGIHTLLDGTPVLTRWLEIRNTSDEPLALTGVAPWTSKLWAHVDCHQYAGGGFEHAFRLGYFTKDIWAWEGWFEWQGLPYGRTELKCDKGAVLHRTQPGEGRVLDRAPALFSELGDGIRCRAGSDGEPRESAVRPRSVGLGCATGDRAR